MNTRIKFYVEDHEPYATWYLVERGGRLEVDRIYAGGSWASSFYPEFFFAMEKRNPIIEKALRKAIAQAGGAA